MKRQKTSHPNMVRYPNGTFYYKQGRREVSLRTKDEADALKRIRYISKKYDPLTNLNTRLRVKELTEPYLQQRQKDFEAKEIRPSTLKETKYIIENHFVSLNERSVAKIDNVAWQDIKTKIKLKDLSNFRKVFGHFMKWCAKNGYVSGVPIMDFKRPTRRRRRILRPVEIRNIWMNSDGSLKLFISMALFMGMRRTEIMTLEWPRVSFEDKSLFLSREITKTKEDRSIPLAAEVERLLIERLKNQKEKGIKTKWVFPNANDVKRHADKSGLKTAWTRCKRLAFGTPKEDVTWHDLRATCEFYAHKRSDLTPTQLEKFFGASIDVQRKTYVSFDVDDLRGVEKSLGLQTVNMTYGNSMGDLDSKDH